MIFLSHTLVRIFYLGTNYHGSQWQPGLSTVQGELLKALSLWYGSPLSLDAVNFAGRTDKGVHSLGQLVSIECDKPLNIYRINRFLPDDIILWASTPAPDGFRPRFDTLMRHYRYHLADNPHLNISVMRRALQSLIGSHDFTFLSKPDGNRPTITTILNASLVSSNGVLLLDIIGTNFLWKLVRKLVTLLKQIGLGIYPVTKIEDILHHGVRLRSGIDPAPPEGLFLMESIVPLHFTPDKGALQKIRALLATQISFLSSQLTALSSIASSLFHNGTTFLF